MRKLQRITRSAADLHVLIVHDRRERRVEIGVHLYGQDFRSEENGDDLIACVEGAFGKLVSQVKKRKDRVTDHSPHR